MNHTCRYGESPRLKDIHPELQYPQFNDNLYENDPFLHEHATRTSQDPYFPSIRSITDELSDEFSGCEIDGRRRRITGLRRNMLGRRGHYQQGFRRAWKGNVPSMEPLLTTYDFSVPTGQWDHQSYINIDKYMMNDSAANN